MNKCLTVLAVIAALLTLVPSCILAQETIRSSAVGFGSTNLLDTYITQEKFSGAGITYLHTRERWRPDSRWSTVVEHELNLATTEDRSQTCTAMETDYYLYWGRYRRWRLAGDRFLLQAGGFFNTNLGFVYDISGSNNPAQAHFAMNLMPSATATWRFQVLKHTFALRYELCLPLVGFMFSPNYGQSYYEIFNRGDYDHNIVPTTFVSAPSFRQMITIDWRASRKWDLRIGYLGNYQQAQVNNLKQHAYTHRFVIGVVKTINQ